MPKEVITKHIEKISFGVVSPTLIKKIGVINVVTPEIYDADGYPVKKGLMDPNMGVIDPGLRCKTCGGRMKTCPGHFGYITLSKAVLHILYIDTIHKLLRSTCGECGRVLMNQKKLEDWTAKFEDAKRTHNIEKTRALMSTLFASLKTVKSCPYCTAKKKPVKLIKPTTFQLDTERLWPDQIREWFEKIPDTDLAALGYDPAIIRPEWLVLSLLLVPPITIRPSITLESGERSEDDLTQFDDLINEFDAEDLKNAGIKKPIKPDNKVPTKHGKMTRKKKRNSDINPLGNNPLEKTTTHQGALTAGEPIKVSSLISSSIMPQSPVINNFIDKQISYRMKKDLDNMSNSLSFKSNSLLKENNDNDFDIIIDDNIFEDKGSSNGEDS